MSKLSYKLWESCARYLVSPIWYRSFKTQDSHFKSFSILAIDTSESLVGLPNMTLSLLWLKNLGKCIDLLTLGESRILGFNLPFDSWYVMFLNVYLSYYSIGSTDKYKHSRKDSMYNWWKRKHYWRYQRCRY